MKTFFSIILNSNPAAMYDSYEDSTRGPPDRPSQVHLKKKGITGNHSMHMAMHGNNIMDTMTDVMLSKMSDSFNQKI